MVWHRSSKIGLAVVLLLGGCAACGGDPGAAQRSVDPSGVASSAGPTTSGETPRTDAPSTGDDGAAPSALDDLLSFLEAADALDERLRAVAPLVSAAVHADEVVVEESTAAAVRALDARPVGAAIPAGLPDDLLRPVLVVYSDLVSRIRAMSGYAYAGAYPRSTDPEGPTDGAHMVECLANGSEAARRFAHDLAAARAAAEAAPPAAPVDPTSTAAATLAVRLEDVDLRNSGCGGCGGYVSPGLATVVWDDTASTVRTGSVSPADQGADSGVTFTATYDAATGWSVRLNAC